MKNGTILIGVKRFLSKEGKEYCVLQLSKPFSENQTKSGCFGSQVEEKFIPETLFEKASSLVPGKQIYIAYDVVGNRAYIVGFSQK